MRLQMKIGYLSRIRDSRCAASFYESLVNVLASNVVAEGEASNFGDPGIKYWLNTYGINNRILCTDCLAHKILHRCLWQLMLYGVFLP